MVENFQSLGAIERDLREHAYEYWFLRAEDDGRIVGYTGGRAEPGDEPLLHLEGVPAGRGTRQGLRLAGHRLLRAAVPRARPRGDVPHGEQTQRPWYSRLSRQGIRNHRRCGNRHRQRLRHGRLSSWRNGSSSPRGQSPTVLAEPSATRVLIYAAVESLLASATVSQPSGTSASLWHCVQYITEARCALWHSAALDLAVLRLCG